MSQNIKDALQRLSISDTDRLLTARLWEVIADIDSAIAAGVKEATIKKILLEQGLELPPHSLRGVLYRYRKKKKASAPSAHPRLASPTEAKPSRESEVLKTVASQTSNPGTYRNDLNEQEKKLLESMDPSEKINFFRQRYTQNKFTHNPTPERFRKDGD